MNSPNLYSRLNNHSVRANRPKIGRHDPRIYELVLVALEDPKKPPQPRDWDEVWDNLATLRERIQSDVEYVQSLMQDEVQIPRPPNPIFHDVVNACYFIDKTEEREAWLYTKRAKAPQHVVLPTVLAWLENVDFSCDETWQSFLSASNKFVENQLDPAVVEWQTSVRNWWWPDQDRRTAKSSKPDSKPRGKRNNNKKNKKGAKSKGKDGKKPSYLQGTQGFLFNSIAPLESKIVHGINQCRRGENTQDLWDQVVEDLVKLLDQALLEMSDIHSRYVSKLKAVIAERDEQFGLYEVQVKTEERIQYAQLGKKHPDEEVEAANESREDQRNETYYRNDEDSMDAQDISWNLKIEVENSEDEESATCASHEHAEEEKKTDSTSELAGAEFSFGVSEEDS